MARLYYAYIMKSAPRGTLYVGVSSDVANRSAQHRDGIFPGFTKRYGVKLLVWFEIFEDVHLAIQREKTIKKWPRQWKTNLVERDNPHWEDLGPRLSM